MNPALLALVLYLCYSAAGQQEQADKDHPPCHDKESRCSTWAGSNQCQENPHYMLEYCTRSCQVGLLWLTLQSVHPADQQLKLSTRQVALQCSLPKKAPPSWTGHATDHATRLFATMFPGAAPAASAGLFRKDPSLGTLYMTGTSCSAIHLCWQCPSTFYQGVSLAGGVRQSSCHAPLSCLCQAFLMLSCVGAGQKLRGDPWLYLSSLGVGTYLGTTSLEDDTAATAAIVQSAIHGWNVIDTAANYREGHGEACPCCCCLLSGER